MVPARKVPMTLSSRDPGLFGDHWWRVPVGPQTGDSEYSGEAGHGGLTISGSCPYYYCTSVGNRLERRQKGTGHQMLGSGTSVYPFSLSICCMARNRQAIGTCTPLDACPRIPFPALARMDPEQATEGRRIWKYLLNCGRTSPS